MKTFQNLLILKRLLYCQNLLLMYYIVTILHEYVTVILIKNNSVSNLFFISIIT
nr:MAG TPA: hypothetical protein [Caudoviricetes sp.]